MCDLLWTKLYWNIGFTLKVTIPISSSKIYHSWPEIPEGEAGYYSFYPLLLPQIGYKTCVDLRA
jgi:hypothetical protein